MSTIVHDAGVPIPPGPREPNHPPAEREPYPERDPRQQPWEDPDDQRRKVNLPPERPREIPVS